MTKQTLEKKLGIPLKAYQTPNWAAFRGDHHPQSCICDEAGDVVGLILRELEDTFISLPALDELTYCCISDNQQLTAIEFEQALPALRYLDLSDNQLKNPEDEDNTLLPLLPSGFNQLERLDLSRNQLKGVGIEGKFPALTMLDLSDNKIKNWNVWELKNFPKLEYFYFKNNSLNDSLTAYHKGGANYLAGLKALEKAFEKGERVLNKEYKLLVVGDGKAGKTAFVNRLVLNKYIKPKGKYWDSSHAISVKQFTNKDGLYDFDYLLNVWDFGGQDIYHTTHRLFMQSNSTYILVWSRETEIEEEYTERKEGGELRTYNNKRWKYWLRYIAYLGENSPVVIAQSHKPKRSPLPPHPHKAVIEKGYQDQFEALIFTHMDSVPDILEKNNYKAVVQSLKKAIDGLRRIEYLPEHWVKIRTALEQRRNAKPKELDQHGNNIMAYTDFCDLAEEMGEDNPEVILETWLVKTGVVFYKDGLFKNQIILNQEWAIKAIYTLFDRAKFYYEIEKSKGKFSGKDLQRYWKAYTAEEQKLFLSFMTSCQMCFEIRERDKEERYRNRPFAERQFMAIEMLPKDRPKSFGEIEEYWQKKTIPLAYLEYRHSFLHLGIIQSFIAKTFHFANVDKVYRQGIFLRIEEVPVLIEATTDEKEHNGAITIKLPKAEIATLNRIRKEFSTIHERKDIPELVSLDGKVYVSLKKLANKQNEQQVEAICGTTVNVADFQCFLQKEEQVESLSEEVERAEKKARGVVKKEYPREEKRIIEIVGAAPIFVPFKKQKKVKILFLSATPSDEGQMNTGLESRRFKNLMQFWDNHKRFKLKEQHGVNADEFLGFLIKEKPHILHYGGHGEVEGIVLENGNLAGEILRDTLKITKNTQCVVLNACYSVGIAKQIAEYVPYVIGTQGPLNDDSAIAFAEGFYTGIVFENSIEDAFEHGLTRIRQRKLPDADVLILVKGINPNASSMVVNEQAKSERKKGKKKKKKAKSNAAANETVVKIQISQDHPILSQQMTTIESKVDNLDNKLDLIGQTIENLPSALKQELAIVLQKADEGKFTAENMQQIVADIQKGMEVYGKNLPTEIANIWQQAKQQSVDQLDVKGKFKLTIPLIPLFLKYEKELSMDLVKIGRNIWRKGIVF